ncbi:hypothetical protein [Serratia fonticola]|uniref:hypothetical protein n=1 Tax=Serratia fonticola TaxID=47917 RepID=UPI0021772F41|nr:hypothetical protein [Serratia fonticola]CAI2006381.1 Uncharacterised protein [Serratia fonticola]
MNTVANLGSNVTSPTTPCTNLPHDYYVGLVKILLKKSTHAEKFKLAEMIEHEAMRISSDNQAVLQAKSTLVTRVIMGGAK